MKRSEYTELMAKVADGGKVNRETFDAMVEYAKKAKTKRPDESAVIETGGIKEAATTAKGTPAEKKPAKKAAAKKEPKPKAKCSVTQKQDPKMPTKTCPNDSRAGGMCATHYSRLIYRAQAEKAEKAREASRNYAARKRAEKAAEQAAAEKAEKASSKAKSAA